MLHDVADSTAGLYLGVGVLPDTQLAAEKVAVEWGRDRLPALGEQHGQRAAVPSRRVHS